MARRKLFLEVAIAQEAEDELDQIYRYNILNRGLRAADLYLAFLRSKIAGLATTHGAGRPIKGRPDLQYLLMKKRGRGDGHVAVYSVDFERAKVEVFHVFHTKQDMIGRLSPGIEDSE